MGFIEFLVKPENILLAYFTILGILVTLISILGTLNQGVKSSLIPKYYLFRGWNLWYLLSFISSFLFFIDLNLLKIELKYPSLILLIFLFYTTTIFILFFVIHLNRKGLYKRIIKDYEKQIQSKGDNPPALSDFGNNLSYVLKNEVKFEEELEAIKELYKISKKYNHTNPLKELIYSFQKIDESVFNFFIQTFYQIKNSDFSSLDDGLLLQEQLFEIVKIRFREIKDLDIKLNTSGAYLKDFLYFKYTNEFKITNNEEFINHYEKLINNTITVLYQLNEYILKVVIKDDVKYIYLLNQIAELNQCLEDWIHISETDFLVNYYDLKFKDNKTKNETELIDIVDKKLEIIKKAKEELKKKQLNLLYLILYYIEEGQISYSFFKIAYKIFSLKGVGEEFYKFNPLYDIDFVNYDSFTGGAQAIPRFPIDKYRSIILFFEYLKDKDSIQKQFSKFEKENFNDTAMGFEIELKSLDKAIIEKYFNNFTENELTSFKDKMIDLIKLKKKELQLQEKEYILKNEIKEEYKQQFIKDCESVWEEGQKVLKTFLKYEEIKDFDKKDFGFGSYTLHSKIWFLEPFYKNVGLSRSSGLDSGRNQKESKKKWIFNKITELSKGNKTVTLKKFEDIKKYITPNKEYFLLYKDGFDIYSIIGLDWKRSEFQTAEIKINNSIIHFIYTHLKENILFEKDSFILKQNKKGFKDIKKPLVIKIEELTKEDIKKIRESPNNKNKTEKEIKEDVKIRVTEKFDINLNKGKQIFKIKL